MIILTVADIFANSSPGIKIKDEWRIISVNKKFKFNSVECAV
jgi:hypothetical protein